MTKLLTDRPDAAPDSTARTTNAPLASNAVDLTDEAAAPKARLLDLSLTQVLGGSLAAATAAFLGSRLGVVGTIAGASVGSVITATAANLYTNSMHRARDAVLATRVARAGLVDSTPQDLTATSPRQPRPGVVDPTAQGGAEPCGGHHAPASAAVMATPTPTRPGSESRRLGWRSIAVTASVLFAVAAAFLTGVQLTTGAPVTGTDLGSRVTVVREVQPATGDAATDAQDAGAGQGATAPTGTPPPTGTATSVAPATTSPSGGSTTAPSPSTGSSQPTPTGTAPTGGPSATGTSASTPSPTAPTPTGTATPAP